jgi:hypothetical protein
MKADIFIMLLNTFGVLFNSKVKLFNSYSINLTSIALLLTAANPELF